MTRTSTKKYKYLLLCFFGLTLFFLDTAVVFGQTKSTETKPQNSDNPDTIQGQKVLTVCENMPQFIGGQEAQNKYLIENIKLPESATNVLETSTYYATFIIDTTGKVNNVQIINRINKDNYTELENEIIKTIQNMPNWTPGKQDGHKVPIFVTVPIKIEFR